MSSNQGNLPGHGSQGFNTKNKQKKTLGWGSVFLSHPWKKEALEEIFKNINIHKILNVFRTLVRELHNWKRIGYILLRIGKDRNEKCTENQAEREVIIKPMENRSSTVKKLSIDYYMV